MTLETLDIEARFNTLVETYPTLSCAQKDECKDTRIKGMPNTLFKNLKSTGRLCKTVLSFLENLQIR